MRGRNDIPLQLPTRIAALSYTRPVDPRHEWIARNEVLFRSVNENIEQLSEDVEARGWPTADRQIEFHCECGRSCDEQVRMTLSEYKGVRAERDRFVVVPHHVTRDIERVVEQNDRYAVVDKLPEAEPLVGADGAPRSDG